MRKNLAVEYVRCHATAGAELYECAKDAAIMALEENRTVQFIHNDRNYEACPKALKSVVVASVAM